MGFDCPACGSLRAVHHLTNLDLAAAASSNLLLVLAIPVALLGWGRWLVAEWRGEAMPWLSPPKWLWAVLIAVVAIFTVLRNLPAGAWLHS